MKKNLHQSLSLVSMDKQYRYKNFLLIISLFITPSIFSQNPLLLKPSSGADQPAILQIISTKTGNVFYSTRDDTQNPTYGLWSSDGTVAGTKRINLDDGRFTSVESGVITPLGSDKILYAADNKNGRGQLWVSNGTNDGTFCVQDFISSSSSGAIMGVASINNTGIYVAVSNDNHVRLHVTTGTAYGDTTVIHDFGEFNIKRMVKINDVVYFFLINNNNDNILWRTDGTPEGTFKLKDFASALIGFLLDINNVAYFISYNVGDAILGRTDGTVDGTFQLKNLGPSTGYSGYFGTGDAAYFMMLNNNGDTLSLVKSDGTATGTVVVKKFSMLNNDINQNPFFTAIGDTVYFAVYDVNYGKELWKTDGTEAGTTMVGDINPGSASSAPASLTALNNVLYFSANDGSTGSELWKYDPNSGTGPQLVKDIYPGSTSSNISSITPMKNTIVFSAATPGTQGADDELWVSDGTTANTIQIENFKQFNSPRPRWFTLQDNNLFFVAKIDINGDGINKEDLLVKYTAPDKIWTGNVSSDVSDASNWFPVGVPVNTDDVLVPPSPVNSISDPVLSLHSFYNNGSTINVGNGQILISNDFNNEGIINNTNGVLAIGNNGSGSTHNIGAGNFNGQLTFATPENMRISGYSKITTLRIEQADTIFLGNNDLVVDNYPTIVPAIITDGYGSTFMPVGASPVTFNVGSNTASLNPVTLTNNGSSEYLGVNVKDGVYTDGYGYLGDTIKQQIVNKTWDIKELTSGGSPNVNITLQWNASDELLGFDRNNVYFNHYTDDAWDSGTPGIASGSGPYTFTRNGITSFSPFALSSSASALPVTLISFNAINYNDAVQLNWETTSEINTSFYAIERGFDGTTFLKLGQVNAQFNNAPVKEYSYTDAQPLKGANYYRLKMTDADGKFTYSKIIVVRMDNKGTTLQIFPNPAKNVLNVQVNGNGLNEDAILQIIDIIGRNVKEEKINLKGSASVSVDISDLLKGTYHLLLKSRSLNEQGKFVKE